MREKQLLFLFFVVLLNVSLTNCSFFSPEKADAKILSRSLKAEGNAEASAAVSEREVLGQIDQWSGQVMGMGFPAFQPIAPNARFPQSYLGQINQIRDVWKGVRERVAAANHPKSAEVQVYLAGVVGAWQARENALTELSTLLAQCTQAIQANTRDAGYMMGQDSTHPTVVNTLNQKVRAYSPPPEKSAATLSELRLKYKLTDSDIQ